MAYVNFKEEISVLKEQLENRKKNNRKLYNDIIKKKLVLKDYNPSLKYSYKKITDMIIGQGSVLHVSEFKLIINKDIIGTKFIRCKFNNVKFKDCKFIGCVFEECVFDGGGVVFENCTFTKIDSEKLPSLNRKDNLGCSFYNCLIYSRFLNCKLSYSIFENSKIENTSFELSDMKDTIIYKCELINFEIIDCDLSGFKTFETYMVDIYFEDKYKSKFDEKTFFDKIMPRHKDKQEYEGLYMTYKILADKFKDNNLNSNFGEYYYLGKCMERKTINIIPKIGSYINWMICGYGERPWFCVVSSLVIITFFAIIYLLTGMDINGEIVVYNIYNIKGIQIDSLIMHINEAMNMSIGMFAGVGINNAKPIGVNYIVANLEMLIGVAMVGVGIGTITRKVIR